MMLIANEVKNSVKLELKGHVTMMDCLHFMCTCGMD